MSHSTDNHCDTCICNKTEQQLWTQVQQAVAELCELYKLEGETSIRINEEIDNLFVSELNGQGIDPYTKETE